MSRRAGVNSALIRQLNVARVFHALRRYPNSSQRELVGVTGLDKATISAVVAQLEADELLERSSRAHAGRPGRPEVALAISRRAGVLIGGRLEPDSIRLLVTTLAGERLGSLQLPGSLSLEKAAELLSEGTFALLEEVGSEPTAVKGLGIGIPALMDGGGRLALAPNLDWREVAIKEMLQRHLPFPVYVDNDTKAAALAEKLFGACQEVRDFIFVAGHSGVGGALYLGGALYRGASGYAGELGHVKVRPGGRPCACGGRGCLEAYISQSAILQRLAEEGLELASLFEVANQAQIGNPLALRVLEETGQVLGEVCADLVNLFNPERIVLGGNYSIVAPYALASLEGALQREALAPPLRSCRVVVSPLGTDSVTMGGIALALEGVLSLPGWLAAAELRGLST